MHYLRILFIGEDSSHYELNRKEPSPNLLPQLSLCSVLKLLRVQEEKKCSFSDVSSSLHCLTLTICGGAWIYSETVQI